MILLFHLFFRFFQVGLFAIGGGMATIPFLYEISDATGWFTHTDLANMIAVSESTPGPIGVNMATYVGFVAGSQAGSVGTGILGAVIATLGLITPSIIIILIIAHFLTGFRDNRYVNHGLYGLRAASAGMIASAGITVALANLIFSDLNGLFQLNWKGILLAVLLWFFTNRVKVTKKLHPIIFIAASAIIGIVFSM